MNSREGKIGPKGFYGHPGICKADKTSNEYKRWLEAVKLFVEENQKNLEHNVDIGYGSRSDYKYQQELIDRYKNFLE